MVLRQLYCGETDLEENGEGWKEKRRCSGGGAACIQLTRLGFSSSLYERSAIDMCFVAS